MERERPSTTTATITIALISPPTFFSPDIGLGRRTYLAVNVQHGARARAASGSFCFASTGLQKQHTHTHTKNTELSGHS